MMGGAHHEIRPGGSPKLAAYLQSKSWLQASPTSRESEPASARKAWTSSSDRSEFISLTRRHALEYWCTFHHQVDHGIYEGMHLNDNDAVWVPQSERGHHACICATKKNCSPSHQAPDATSSTRRRWDHPCSVYVYRTQPNRVVPAGMRYGQIGAPLLSSWLGDTSVMNHVLYNLEPPSSSTGITRFHMHQNGS